MSEDKVNKEERIGRPTYRVPRVMRKGEVFYEEGQITPPELALAALAEIHKSFRLKGITPDRIAEKVNKLLVAKKENSRTVGYNIFAVVNCLKSGCLSKD